MTDQEQRWMAIGKAIERAAEELPMGVDMYIELEQGAGGVRLMFPEDDGPGLSDWEGGPADQINAAIDYAIATINH